MYPHRIRLRGPWECEPLPSADGQPAPPPRRMTLPCRWAEGGLVGFAGRVRFRRRFGYPGNLDSSERVWLTFAGAEGDTTVSLNGQMIDAPDSPMNGFEYEVTALLQMRNELLVEIDGPATGGLWGEVAMEIRRTAFLRNIRLHAEDGLLHVEGEIAGFAERPLELYAVAGRSTAAYCVLEAGRQFRLLSEPLVLRGPHPVRVDLVDGASVWYTLERVVDFPAPAQEEGSEWTSSR